MSNQTIQKPRYTISVVDPKDGAGSLVFTFVLKGVEQARHASESPKRAPQYIVSARANGDAVNLDWNGTADDPGQVKPDIKMEVHERLSERTKWLDRISALVARVEQWGKELEWFTRRIEKRLDDPRIGKHTAPALLMQADTVRVLLEPVARSVPGGEGLVELSLMPTYDDIASLYYRDGDWHLHYIFPDAKAATTVRSAESKPLSKDALALVLEEMKKHG